MKPKARKHGILTERARHADAQLWRADDLGADLLRGRFTDFAYDVHTHDTACLALITAGAIRIRMRGTEFVAQAGDLYAIDVDEAHAGWPIDADGWSQRTIYVDLSRLESLIEDHDRQGGGLSLRGPIIRDAGLSRLFYDVHRASEEHRGPLHRDERYLDFAQSLLSRHVRQAATPRAAGSEISAVRRARDYLDFHLEDRVRLADIAAAASLPPFRIYRAFEQSLGMTPHAYQRQARIRRAIDLIRSGHPLADVATAAGFADQAHLTRSFQRRMGLTPGAYQTAYGAIT
jgi:AraC-like DNA-binding protein